MTIRLPSDLSESRSFGSLFSAIDPPFGDQRRSALPLMAYFLDRLLSFTLNNCHYIEYDKDVTKWGVGEGKESWDEAWCGFQVRMWERG